MRYYFKITKNLCEYSSPLFNIDFADNCLHMLNIKNGLNCKELYNSLQNYSSSKKFEKKNFDTFIENIDKYNEWKIFIYK